MDYKYEQQQELEVLQSIYPDELEIISETHFTIRIGLDTQTDRTHTLLLDVRFPETYPEVVPRLAIEVIDEEPTELNVGTPSIFAITAILKDEAELLFQTKVDAAQKAYDDQLLAKEAEEQKKFHGTKVTKESFEKWRKTFREEMKIDEQMKLRFEKLHNGKMTGRERFEKGLAGEADDDLGDLAEVAAKLEV
ncbi:RWD-domain-containing protein [Metschnikowia bicuspidata]|uniref:RWD-domain-containing protein n=1 Tax=Metschnikowia bicuspidata TaxID=27322 RepID=A0A4P9ZHC5_9ASCO|nr:RWD-domain-containing protein [Metschnikowia bicuspidata]